MTQPAAEVALLQADIQASEAERHLLRLRHEWVNQGKHHPDELAAAEARYRAAQAEKQKALARWLAG
jgi:hypothetical protein